MSPCRRRKKTYSVRGFDGENVLAADRGWLLRNELGWRPFDNSQEVYIGVDYGEVAGRDSAYLLGTHLGGAAFGLRGSWRWLAYDVFASTYWDKPAGFITQRTTTGFNISIGF